MDSRAGEDVLQPAHPRQVLSRRIRRGQFVEASNAGAPGYCFTRSLQGPVTYNACSTVMWNEASAPISRHGCIGCSEDDSGQRLLLRSPDDDPRAGCRPRIEAPRRSSESPRWQPRSASPRTPRCRRQAGRSPRAMTGSTRRWRSIMPTIQNKASRSTTAAGASSSIRSRGSKGTCASSQLDKDNVIRNAVSRHDVARLEVILKAVTRATRGVRRTHCA